MFLQPGSGACETVKNHRFLTRRKMLCIFLLLRFAASQSKIVKASYTPQNLRFWGVKIETYKSSICAPKPTVLRDLDSIQGIKNFFIKNF
jgi:hypothetical protein